MELIADNKETISQIEHGKSKQTTKIPFHKVPINPIKKDGRDMEF